MFINRLKIENLRNIEQAELVFENNTNIVTGKNGAGKTSILEAIYLLGRAKSFRSGNNSSPIKQGNDRLNIFSNLKDENGSLRRIGLSKSAQETVVQIDGTRIKKLSELANTIPIALVTPQSHRLLEEGPEHRRRLINWGVFHVEHSYRKNLTEYSRSLLQRNNALRNGSSDLSIWNRSLVSYAEKVSQLQEQYFESWKSVLMTISKDIDYLKGLDIRFQKGWKRDRDLADLLTEKENLDRERGYTTVGPQRAELAIRVDGAETKQRLSRGQQKVLIILMMLSQARLLKEKRDKNVIFLLDDLESELSQESLSVVCAKVESQGGQTFITSLDPDKIKALDWTKEFSMFHVEHGKFY